jgi:hypothetical protein
MLSARSSVAIFVALENFHPITHAFSYSTPIFCQQLGASFNVIAIMIPQQVIVSIAERGQREYFGRF